MQRHANPDHEDADPQVLAAREVFYAHEWLMDARIDERPSLRRAAGDELKILGKEHCGDYDDLPKKERAQALYRAWWGREGRQRFL